LRNILLKLVNIDYEDKVEEKGGNLINQIKNEELKNEIIVNREKIEKNFSEFLRTEQEFVLDQIDLDKGIGKNTLLKENVFLLFLSVITNIPLIIIGKPGSGKSLSAQLIKNSLKGKYSKNKFFQLFPQIIQIYFQGSKSTEPEDVKHLFKRAKLKLNHFKKEKLKKYEESKEEEKLNQTEELNNHEEVQNIDSSKKTEEIKKIDPKKTDDNMKNNEESNKKEEIINVQEVNKNVDMNNLEHLKKNEIENKNLPGINESIKEKEELPIIMVLFDELGLAERSKKNPLKVLHSKLEYKDKRQGISFVGISNYSLDAAKINRALVLSVPDLDQRLDEIIVTANNIVESISEKLKKEQIFEILSNTYFNYKKELQFIKELVVYKKYKNEVPQTPTTNLQVKDKPQNDIQEYQPNNNNDTPKPKGDITDINKFNNLNITINSTNTDIPDTANKTENNTDRSESETESKLTKEKELNEKQSTKLQKGENNRERRQFESIKKQKEYITLFKKEDKINKDFHGNRDFYNLIKGIAIELGRKGDINNTEKLPIIIKYIERNFGGIEYEIDIDFNSSLDDIRENMNILKTIVDDYENEDKNIIKMSSVFLFKELYNLEFKNDPNSTLKINEKEIKNYDLNNCINENIKDIYGRYLLLQVSSSLTTLIYQNIKLQNPLEDIQLYDGSPFVDDNNKEYRFKKINKIQDDARLNRIIVLENLNQIHPFLFDLYNRNYIIKDEKKFIRICLENDNEQLTLVNDRFRIIILVDKRYVNQCELAFLNRLEKMILSFDKLLDNSLKPIAKSLIDELKFKNIIRKHRKMNYSLGDLLINCKNEDIEGLIYYFSKESKKKKNENEIDSEDDKEENIDEKLLKEKVIDKLYKILPQDIICVLPKKNRIKEKYNLSKKIFNFNDYIKEEYRQKDEKLRFKISIIYTFTSLTNVINGQNIGTRFLISEIRSEDGLKNLIEEIQKKNEYNKLEKENYICIHFDQLNSKNIKFVSNYILNTFNDDNYIYIFIIHINRNFNNKNNEKIFSLPDINPKINQIFIDNLNGNNISLNDLLTKNIKDILEDNKENLQLDKEFDKALNNFINKNLNEREINNDNNDYFNKIKKYMDENDSIKEKIVDMTYKLIISESDEDESNCAEIVRKMYDDNFISKYTVDIASCLIEYIKENIYNEYLKKVFEILEDNNIFTTLYENINNNFRFIKKNIVEEIISKFFVNIEKEKKDKYESKFLFGYNVPGFYNFFAKITNYIDKNIKPYYFNNEKKLRELSKKDDEKIKEYYEKEYFLFNDLLSEISKNHKYIYEIIYKISDELLFNDYITFFLQKYKNKEVKDIYNKDDVYHKLLKFLLELRFKDDNRIIKINNDNKTNILFIKIMWMESNVNFIINILQIFDKSLIIFNDRQINLLDKIKELIFEQKIIKYIINDKNAQSKEVNECYYILLASLCYSITSDQVKLIKSGKKSEESDIEVNHYRFNLFEINKILQKLNNELNINLNEMYIIDELIQLIDVFKKSYDIKKINDIKELLRENSLIIQRYSNDNNYIPLELSEELIKNINQIYEIIKIYGQKNKKDKIFYDKIKYLFLKEITKIPDDNYRHKILEIILEENEIIKISNDIFQILLEKYLKTDITFKENSNKILNGDDYIIIKFLEQKLNNNFILSETLLYLFEKNSLIYLKNALNSKKSEIYLEDDPLEVLKECIRILDYYIFKPTTLSSKLKETCKLFCLGYIKVYVYMFIKMFSEKNPKFKDSTKIIIEGFNGESPIKKMIRIFAYKVLYNMYKIDVFIAQDKIENFKLEKYSDYKELVETNELINIYKIDYKIKTLKDENYEDSYKAFEKLKKNGFKKEINVEDIFDIEEYGIDNFYVVSYNTILSNLQIDNSEGNTDFYKNVCEPLFKNNNLLLNAIQLFYDPQIYNNIKNQYKINSNNIKPILFGYRICLNTIYYKKESSIYYSLYDSKNIKYLQNKLYPGNSTKFIITFSLVKAHFENIPDEGCYVCLCENKCYHSVPSGFPGREHLDMTCQGCKKNIGAIKKGNEIFPVKRENYFRIFKNQDEINKIDKNLLDKINYMTLDAFEKKMEQSFKEERGIYKDEKINLINDAKIIRNLSQITYRILNYILYTNLFFAKLLLTDQKEFDQYKPKHMEWGETLSECWNLIQKELKKINIFSIDEFMNYLIIDLLPMLNNEKVIDKYDKLIELENNLEKKIQQIIKNYKEEGYKLDITKNESDNDKKSLISLLKEKYSKDSYKMEEYPFYEYFYYTDYLNEEYLNKELEKMYLEKYPVLKKYLENKNKVKEDNNKYSLEYLYIFNNALNLISENYYNKISRDSAQKTKLKETDIYMNNTEIIDKFIAFYNNLDDIKDNNNINIKLNVDNKLEDFFIEDNGIGITYKYIYKKFIKMQNEKIEPLLNIKVSKGLFDNNCKTKVNIQQINERDIFTLKLPKNISFFDILFNFSYRKIMDSKTFSNKSYREYEINYDIIEENLTDLLLNNKKLFNDEIIDFSYNDELFGVQLSPLITLFKDRYNCKDISMHDKIEIFKFSEENRGNLNLCKNMVNDFITLLKYLNNEKKDKNKKSEIKEENKISDLITKYLNDSVKPEFLKFFVNEGFTVDKTSNIFDYYLKTIYETIKSELDKYQEKKLSDDSIKEINKYYEKKDPFICKKDIAYSIRIFATLVLSQEKDKKKKIQSNTNNLINYLRSSELWTKEIYDNPDFNKNLNELKLWKVQINQIIPLYEFIEKDIEDNYFDDVKKRIENEKNANKPVINIEINEPNEPFEENEKKEDIDDDPFKKKDPEEEDDPFAKKDNSDEDE